MYLRTKSIHLHTKLQQLSHLPYLQRNNNNDFPITMITVTIMQPSHHVNNSIYNSYITMLMAMTRKYPKCPILLLHNTFISTTTTQQHFGVHCHHRTTTSQVRFHLEEVANKRMKVLRKRVQSHHGNGEDGSSVEGTCTHAYTYTHTHTNTHTNTHTHTNKHTHTHTHTHTKTHTHTHTQTYINALPYTFIHYITYVHSLAKFFLCKNFTSRYTCDIFRILFLNS